MVQQRNLKRSTLYITTLITILGAFFYLSCREESKNVIKAIRDKASGVTKAVTQPKSSASVPFAIGEKLIYGIYVAGIKVGQAEFTYQGKVTIDGLELDLIELNAKATGYRESEKIYGSIENFSPHLITRTIQLFGEHIDIAEKYNHEKNEVIVMRKSKKTTTQKLQAKNSLRNVILLLYHFRFKKNNYHQGSSFEFTLPTKQVKMIVDSYRNIKVPYGQYQSLFLKSNPSQFKIWFKDDDDSLPLRVEGAIGFGNTYLALMKVEQPS